MVVMATDLLHTQTFDAQLSDSTALAVKVLEQQKMTIDLNVSKYDYERSAEWMFYVKLLWAPIPLFDRQIRSIPFRCSAIRASSQNDSLMLKSHSGEISKHAILLRDAYSSACLAATWRLNAKCNRFPTNTFGTPGACCVFHGYQENVFNENRLVCGKFNFRVENSKTTNLFNFLQPSIDAIKTPFVCYVIDQYNTLCPAWIWSYYRTKSSLT